MFFTTELNQPKISALLFPKRDTFSKAETAFLKISDTEYPVQSLIADNSKPTIILFSATNVALPKLDEMVEGFRKKQINMVIVSTPESREGNPLFLQEYTDAGPMIFKLIFSTRQKQGRDGPLFVAGHGLGALPAMQTILNHDKDLKGIILEGVICDLQKFLFSTESNQHKELPDNDHFFQELQTTIAKISNPTLILHGAKDSITSAVQAEKLQSFSSARTKQFFVIPGATDPGEAPLCHWSKELYFNTIETFINNVCGLNTWRERRRQSKNSNKKT